MRDSKEVEIKYPKILIVGRGVWNDENSTLTNIFGGYNPDQLAYICIESAKPSTLLCNQFFQISEITLIKRLFNRKIKTGGRIFCDLEAESLIKESDNEKEQSLMSFVRRNRSIVFLFLRELLWSFNGWKTKELNKFIEEFNPDNIFLLGDPLPLMNRLQNHIIEQAKKPASIFMMDDIYSYKSSVGIFAKLYKSILRKHSGKVIKNCSVHFAISPKLKKEYDKIFGIESIILTKGIDFSQDKQRIGMPLHHPIRIVYTGKLIYGRYKSLAALASALQEINKDEIKAQLFIYTQDEVSTKQQKLLAIDNSSFLMGRVSFNQALGIQKEADILLFVESLDKRYKNAARLSFSTKITDYLHNGKCIFAIGSKDIAPIEYLTENDAAIVSTEYEEINTVLTNLIKNPYKIKEYGEKAYHCGLKNHNNIDIQKKLYQVLSSSKMFKNEI